MIGGPTFFYRSTVLFGRHHGVNPAIHRNCGGADFERHHIHNDWNAKNKKTQQLIVILFLDYGLLYYVILEQQFC